MKCLNRRLDCIGLNLIMNLFIQMIPIMMITIKQVYFYDIDLVLMYIVCSGH